MTRTEIVLVAALVAAFITGAAMIGAGNRNAYQHCLEAFTPPVCQQTLR